MHHAVMAIPIDWDLVSSCTELHLKVATAFIICQITQIEWDGSQEISCNQWSIQPDGQGERVKAPEALCITNSGGMVQ